MNKLYVSAAGALCALAGLMPSTANAVGWPSNYEGVMLQGFYWDSYKGSNTTKWTDLTNQADELSKYFKLIWVANCSRANGEMGGGNGYMPIYWFSNHNCAFGTEAQLKTMIQTFKAKGTGFIEDVVINHRVGVNDWADFPAETWNGVTYQLKSTDVCSSDEWTGGPKGGADTGEDFNGARDLDHNSSNVQLNCKAYTKYLLEELGFVGFRYDMVKGYAPKFTKMYNQNCNVTYSVGEYWDGSYDAVKGWIDGTGKTSAAFDFPCKYQINKCFNNGAHNYTELAWKANGTTDQPAGMIHYGYQQYAVTFVDNHDTYRDGSKMTGDVLQANAFILSSPGTPCVFWPHYAQYKSQIQAMIKARNDAGITNTSSVTVLEVNGNCYVAEIKGTKGKLWLKLGNSGKTAGSGYTKKASGNGYEIWTTTQGGGGGDDPQPGKEVHIYFDNKTSKWATPHIHYWGNTESTWPGVAMTKVNGDVWSYTCPAGTTGILFNAGDGDATKTADFTAIDGHIYSTTGDQGVYSQGGGGGGEDAPAEVYAMGHIKGSGWTPGQQVKMTKAATGNVWTLDVEIEAAGATDPSGYFSFVTNANSTWDSDDGTGINDSDRFGAATTDAPVTPDTEMDVTRYVANVNASAAQSWKIDPGKYTLTFNFDTMKMKAAKAGSGVTGIEADGEEAIWFNLQGVRVERPRHGIYIRVIGSMAEKVRVM